MKVAIIGGSGKMGRWFASFLLQDGKKVVITGRNEEKLLDAKKQLRVETASNAEAVKSADVVLLSVPISEFESVVKQVGPYTHPGQVIADITSIKAHPVEIMHKYIKGSILGIHPMFGPGASDITNRNFVLTPTNNDERALAQKTRGYLEARGARVTMMSPHEHDEMMTIILGLSHFIAIVSADTLVNLGRLKQADAISGSTYKVLLTLAGSVISEDPEFYASVQTSLPGIAEVERLFQEKSRAWANLVQAKNNQELVKRMNTLKNRLEKDYPDFGKAYKNMYRIVEGL